MDVDHPVHYRVSAMTDFKPDFKHRSAYPDEEAAEQAVRARDWARVRAIWDQGTTWRERGQALAGAGVDGSEVFLREVVQRHPDDRCHQNKRHGNRVAGHHRADACCVCGAADHHSRRFQ